MSMIQLIYVSNSVTEMETGELDAILDTAVRNNTPREITGMLLYAGGSFMQVLEGEERAVDEIFARIQQDPRHNGIIVLDRLPITERGFAKWSMGFRRLDDVDAAAHPGYAPFFRNGFDAAAIGAKPGLALEMLQDFGLTTQRA